MPTLNPKITAAGLALFPAPLTDGFSVALTHISIGTGLYTPAVDANGRATQTALQNEVARFPIASGTSPTPTSVQIGTTITDTDPNGKSANGLGIGEIGFWAGSTLFAIWSQTGTPLFYKTAAFDVPLAYTMDVSLLPASSVTVQVTNASGLQSFILAHEAAADPHPGYVREVRGMADYDANVTYATGARVIGDDGKTYKSKVDNNKGNAPSQQPTKWERWAFTLAELDAEIQTPPLGDIDKSISTTEFTQKTIAGVLSKSVAGGSDVQLSAIEAGNGVWILAGALTANINVIVPAQIKRALVVNKTTGSYTLTIKTQNGAGVKISQGYQREIACDGTDVSYAVTDFADIFLGGAATGNTPAQFDSSSKVPTTAFLQRMGMQASSVAIVSTSTTLTASAAGGTILGGASSAITTTLPPLSAFVAGARIEFMNLGTATQTVAQNGGDTGGIAVNGGARLSSLALLQGDSLTLEKVDAGSGVVYWTAVGGNAQLPYSATMKSLLGNMSFVYGYSSGQALTAAHFGSLIGDNVSGPAATYWLPVSQGSYLGKCISFLSVNGNGCTVSTSNNETIVVGGPAGGNTVKNIPLRAGETLTVVNTGAGWYAVDGSALLRYSAGFSNQQSGAGWQKLPSGIVMQWGGGSMNYTTPGSYQSLPVNLPLTCSSLYLVLGTLTSGNSATGTASLSCENYQNWGFTAVYGSNVAQGMSFCYLAICI